MGEFQEKVYAAAERVPRGKVASYGLIARLVGAPRKARFVGYAMHGNPRPWNASEGTGIPCHRVVFKDGRICEGYAFGGPEVQRSLLEGEGVTFVDESHVDMDACLWDGHSDGLSDREGVPEGAPTAPPADFDWERELAEE